MSTLPCDADGAIVRGKLLGCYPSLKQQGVRWSSYRRLCLDHMRDLVSAHQSDWTQDMWRQSDSESRTCTSCHKHADEVGDLCAFYVTLYVRSDSRMDFSAWYCNECADIVKDEFRMKIGDRHARRS